MPKQKVKAVKPPVNELEVLFPPPYTWNLSQVMALAPSFLLLLEGLLKLGLTAENCEEFLGRDFSLLAPALAPIVPEVLAVTLGMSAAEAAALHIGQQSALALKILILNKANQEEIKNWFAGFFDPQNSATVTP
jgi:hypothetical protein